MVDLVLNPNVATGVTLQKWQGRSIQQSIGLVDVPQSELEQGGPDFMCTEDGKLVRNCNQVLTSSCENTILLSYFCYVTVTDSRRKGNRKGVGWRYFYSRFIVSKEREEVVGNWQLAIELPESVPTQQSTTSFCG